MLAITTWTTHAAAQATTAQRFQLRNGLDVVLEPHANATSTAVVVHYHVGTRDQREGYTGLAHLVEHLMFEPSANATDHFIIALEEMGARSLNGETHSDYTTYYEQVPAEHLLRTLWFESDRMAYLLPALSARSIDTQRRVIRNETRERRDPDRLRWMRATHQALYPQGHPYRERFEYDEDLDALTLGHVRWFYQTWYTPSNATLVVAGAMDVAATRAAIERYFGALPSTPAPARPTASIPTLDRTVRVQSDAVGRFAEIQLRWPTPALYTQDDAELDCIAAYLGDQETGRLYRAIVRDNDFASAMHIGQRSEALSSTFAIDLIATEEHDERDVLPIIDEAIVELQRRGIPEDALRAIVRRFVERPQAYRSSIIERAIDLSLLASATPRTQSTLSLDAHNAARYGAVTTESIRRAALRWLPIAARVVSVAKDATARRGDGGSR